jgi:hypothetical protein
MKAIEMRSIVALVFAIALAWHTSAIAQDSFKPIDDPEKLSADLVQMVARGALKDAGIAIADTIGQPAMVQNVQNALQLFEGKKFDYVGKVLDKQFEASLRQIIHYAYVENLGFIYFRFNFKMTSKGWALAHFTFKSETQELFPRDFIDR